MSSLLQAGLSITAIGMGVVFVLLTSLVGIVRGMSALSMRIEGTADASSAASDALGAGPRLSTPSVSALSASDATLAGIIAAAVAAHRHRRLKPRPAGSSPPNA